MEKQSITEDMHLEKEWFDRAETIKTTDELKEFAEELLGKYNHDYGTTCHAITALALAAAHLGAEKEGITGFQAGCIMWGFVKQWNHKENKCGMRLWDFDNMLYPQYAERFDKYISAETWKQVQELAKENLARSKKEFVHPEVWNHWEFIAAGNLPFGFIVGEE